MARPGPLPVRGIGLRRIAVALLLGGALAVPAPAADGTKLAAEAQLKAALVAKLARFVTWPKEGSAPTPATFVVGVLGEDGTGDQLATSLEAEPIKGASVMIVHVDDVAELRDCNLVWIAASARDQAQTITTELSDAPVLILSDGGGLIDLGVHVGLLMTGDRLAFEVNIGALRHAGLDLPSGLLRLAKRVVGAQEGAEGPP